MTGHLTREFAVSMFAVARETAFAVHAGKHVNFGGRLRIGTEHHLDAIPKSLGIAIREGVAERKFAAGVGIDLFRVVRIDGAYARDNYIYDNAVFVSVRFGW